MKRTPIRGKHSGQGQSHSASSRQHYLKPRRWVFVYTVLDAHSSDRLTPVSVPNCRPRRLLGFVQLQRNLTSTTQVLPKPCPGWNAPSTLSSKSRDRPIVRRCSAGAVALTPIPPMVCPQVTMPRETSALRSNKSIPRPETISQELASLP